MKKWIIIIFTFCCTAAYSQKDNSNLSYEECMSLYNAGKISEAIPSLLVLKEHYEQPDNYNGAMYYGIIYALHYYFMQIGDYSSSRNLLNDAGNLFNKRESEPNNEYIRNLLCTSTAISFQIKRISCSLQTKPRSEKMVPWSSTRTSA